MNKNIIMVYSQSFFRLAGIAGAGDWENFCAQSPFGAEGISRSGLYAGGRPWILRAVREAGFFLIGEKNEIIF
jgi:hypothetical protein